MRDGKPCILILDDDKDLASVVADTFRRDFADQIEIFVAHNVSEAQAFLREQREDLDAVVADIMMADDTPGGLEVTSEAIKAGFPVVVVTAHTEEKYAEEAEKLGPVWFVGKDHADFTKRVVAKVRLLLQLKERTRDSTR